MGQENIMKLPKLIKKFKPVLAHQLEMILLWYYSKTAKYRRPSKTTGKILLARTDGLGDFIIWLSCAKAFRQLYPEKKIVLMLDSIKPTKHFAESMPQYFDEVFNIDIHNYTRFFEFKRMMKLEFDEVIQPAYSRVAFTDILLFACKAGKRITLDTNAKFLSARQLTWTNRGYDQIIPTSGGIKHELIRCGELIRGLGWIDFKVGYPDMRQLYENKENYFVCFPAASGPTKIWEAEKYAYVLDKIIRKTGWSCKLCGGKEDFEQLSDVMEQMELKGQAENLAGRKTLPDTITLLNKGQMAIGNDTGAMYMAAACHIPSIVLMGDNELGRFFPYKAEKGESLPLWVVDAGMSCQGCNAMKDVPCRYPFGTKGVYRCIELISKEHCMDVVEIALKELGL